MKRTRLGIGVAITLIAIHCASLNAAQPGLTIQAGVNVSWPTSTGNTYRVQWSPTGGAGTWTDLGGPVNGDATTNSIYDPAPKGVRHYQVLENVPGSAPAASIPVNGGFELGDGFIATNWSTTSSQRPVRTNLFAHSGSFSMRNALTNVSAAPSEATLSQLVVAQGGTVGSGQTYAFSFWARQVTAGPSYLQQYQVQWINSVGGIVGGSGLVNFNGVIGSWTKLSVTNLAVPANAVEARVLFRFVTGAVAGGHGEVFIDDVALDSGGSVAGPGQTNVLQALVQPVARISWPTTAGEEYQPESTTVLGSGTWTNISPMIVGDGGTKSFLVPLMRHQEFIRLQSPSAAVLPPINLRVIAAGLTNAIGLAWNASSTPGVIGHRILHGATSSSLTNSLAVGNVTTATLAGLMPGQTYYLAVVAFTTDAESPPSNIISAQPQTNTAIVPLFDANTPLEPPTTIDTTNALITHVADRARDRHAREGMFSAYDHYLSWYWEERTIAIEFVDRVAKGGTGITFNYTTLIAARRSGVPRLLSRHQHRGRISLQSARATRRIESVFRHHQHEASREPSVADRGSRGDRDQPVHRGAGARTQQLLWHRDSLHRWTRHCAVAGRGPVARFLSAPGIRVARRPDHIAVSILQRTRTSFQTDGGKHLTDERAAVHARAAGCTTPTSARVRIPSQAILSLPITLASWGRSSSRAVVWSAT